MKCKTTLLIGFLLFITLAGSALATELKKLKLLYIGSERTEKVVPFLKEHVAQVESRDRDHFDPADAAAFDVVVLDWPQVGGPKEFPPKSSPLGKREDWAKPTVLLGSAGLKLAVVWQLQGGVGCTCLDPLAYDVRENEIFEKPFKIERTVVSIPTPPAFREEIPEKTIEVLPLVADIHQQRVPGWCSYSDDFAQMPECEYFCGGVNEKTKTAGAIWRQGNLLHFGFEPSPTEMTEPGRQMLLNSIEYISRFSEDRPIARTPSVFVGPVARSRRTLMRWARTPDFQLKWFQEMMAPALLEKLPKDRQGVTEFIQANSSFFRPSPDHKYEMDDDLVALHVAFDTPEFFDRTIAGLRAGGADAERATRLLDRYVPIGPKNATADDWAAWWNENKPYAFASDAGDYCWYIDPLAKKRGVPSAELRGAKRADVPALSASR